MYIAAKGGGGVGGEKGVQKVRWWLGERTVILK